MMSMFSNLQCNEIMALYHILIIIINIGTFSFFQLYINVDRNFDKYKFLKLLVVLILEYFLILVQSAF